MKCKDTCCFDCKHQVDRNLPVCQRAVFQCHGAVAESLCMEESGGVCTEFEKKDGEG